MIEKDPAHFPRFDLEYVEVSMKLMRRLAGKTLANDCSADGHLPLLKYGPNLAMAMHAAEAALRTDRRWESVGMSPLFVR